MFAPSLVRRRDDVTDIRSKSLPPLKAPKLHITLPSSSLFLSLIVNCQKIMIGSRTALRAARTARAPVRCSARRFASTNQQAAAAGGSSGLVGGLAGGAIVFTVRFAPPILQSISNSVNSAWIRLLSLLRRKIHRQCSLLHKEPIQQAHAKHPRLCTRTQRSVEMAQINGHFICRFHSGRKGIRRFRIQRSRQSTGQPW